MLIRRAYKDTVRFLLQRENRPGTGRRLFMKALSAHIRPGLMRPIASPMLATVEVTRRCNLACRHCRFIESHAATEHGEYLSELVRSISEAGFVGIGFTGGEPLILDDFERTVRLAVERGLITHVNTNGTLITPSRALRLLESGLTSINISLDGAGTASHDFLRGKGSFAKALAGAEALVRARARLCSGTRILFVMRLCDTNASEVDALLSLADKTGVDGCSFLPLHDSVELNSVRAPAHDAARAALQLAECKGGMESMIDNSAKYLRGMARFFNSSPMPNRCSALHTSLYFSADHKLYPCVPSAMRSKNGIPFVPGELLNIFRSRSLSRCLDAQLCLGCWWNCHRELDIALGVL
ncbi:MAG: radical SAM protein [Planctomycetota bacterium]